MRFKNMMVYTVQHLASINDEVLKHFAFTPCGSQDMAKTGWIAPVGEALTFHSNGQILLSVMREERVLPSHVIKAELAKKVARLEGEQSRKLKKTEKDALKDEVLHALIPRAFTRNKVTNIRIDLINSRIIVDTSSARQAEDALALLRKSIGSLPVVPFQHETPLELIMTQWVKDDAPPVGFALGEQAVLKSILEGGGVGSFKTQDLTSDEIKTHLDAGKVVTELSLSWKEHLTFTLCNDGTIKRIKFSDVLIEQNDDMDPDDKAARFDADFVLFSGECDSMFNNLTRKVDTL